MTLSKEGREQTHYLFIYDRQEDVLKEISEQEAAKAKHDIYSVSAPSNHEVELYRVDDTDRHGVSSFIRPDTGSRSGQNGYIHARLSHEAFLVEWVGERMGLGQTHRVAASWQAMAAYLGVQQAQSIWLKLVDDSLKAISSTPQEYSFSNDVHLMVEPVVELTTREIKAINLRLMNGTERELPFSYPSSGGLDYIRDRKKLYPDSELLKENTD